MNGIKILLISATLLVLFENESIAQTARLRTSVTKKRVSVWKNQKIEHVSQQVLIKLKPEVSKGNALLLLAQNKVDIIEDFDKLGWALVEIPKDVNEINFIESLRRNPLVASAIPDIIMHSGGEFIPNDPYLYEQWGIKNTGQNGGVVDADIDAPEAWAITRGSSNVKIAILDSGIPITPGSASLSHPELNDASRFILGPDYIECQ